MSLAKISSVADMGIDALELIPIVAITYYTWIPIVLAIVFKWKKWWGNLHNVFFFFFFRGIFYRKQKAPCQWKHITSLDIWRTNLWFEFFNLLLSPSVTLSREHKKNYQFKSRWKSWIGQLIFQVRIFLLIFRVKL